VCITHMLQVNCTLRCCNTATLGFGPPLPSACSPPPQSAHSSLTLNHLLSHSFADDKSLVQMLPAELPTPYLPLPSAAGLPDQPTAHTERGYLQVVTADRDMHSSSRGQGFTVVRGARGKQEDVLVLHPDARFLLVAGKNFHQRTIHMHQCLTVHQGE
jgi:hypothetical protein